MKFSQSHLQRKKNRQFWFYLLSFLIVIFIFFTIGIRVLINIIVFIAEITHPTEEIITKNKNENFFTPAEIVEIPTATNSSTIKIIGKGEEGKKIFLYVNNKKQQEKELNEDNFEILAELEEGENLVYLITKDPKTNEEKKSKIYRVIYKSEKPQLEIIFPKDGETINQEEIQVVGKTQKEVFVKINEMPVVVDADGDFKYQLRLEKGENIINVTASDIAGNETSLNLKVYYEKND